MISFTVRNVENITRQFRLLATMSPSLWTKRSPKVKKRDTQAQDSALCKIESLDVVTPQEAMANSECIAAAYEGFSKDIDKLQQVISKGQEMEDKIKQRRRHAS